MITALLALQAQVLSFPGGDVEQLADFVMQASGSNVVAIASENSTLPVVSVDDKDKKLRWVKFAAKLGLESANLKAPCNLGFRSLPMFQNNGSPRLNSKYFQQWKEAIQFLPADDRKQGRRHVSATIAVANLSKLKLDKSLKVHWVLKDYVVVLRAKGKTSRDILEAVADAVGGEVVETKSTYRLDIDPAAIRRRFSEQLQVQVDTLRLGEHFRLGALARADIVRRATDAQIRKAFKDDQGYALIDLPKNSAAVRLTLQQLALARRMNLAEGTLVDSNLPIVGVIYNYWSVCRRGKPTSGNIPVEF